MVHTGVMGGIGMLGFVGVQRSAGVLVNGGLMGVGSSRGLRCWSVGGMMCCRQALGRVGVLEGRGSVEVWGCRGVQIWLV